MGITGKFVSVNNPLEKDVFYKIIGKSTTAIISVGFNWDGVRSLYVVSTNTNGNNNRVSIIIEYTGASNSYIGRFYQDSGGNIYLKGYGNGHIAQLISFSGTVYLEKTSKAESELNLMNNNIVQ